MFSDFEQVHNYYERLVFEEIVRRAVDYAEFSEDMLADVACVALNRLPTRYVRHDADLMFYMTENERYAMDISITATMDFAFSYVGRRARKAEPETKAVAPVPAPISEQIAAETVQSQTA